MRLIDANALLKNNYVIVRGEDGEMVAGQFIDIIREAPTIDAVEVVRCKDCRHMENTPDGLRWCHVWAGINGMGDEGFCSYGERKYYGK